MAENEAPERPRRQFDAQEIVAILKRHLVDGEKVSDLCEALDLSPNQFYRWQKEFFDNGAIAFERRGRRENAQVRKLEQCVERLQAKLVKKDSVIAELLEDHVRLKKSFGED
jgi:transposase-like protein